MSVACTVTAGKTFSGSEVWTESKLNLLGVPTVVIPDGSVVEAALSSGVQTKLNTLVSAISAYSAKSADFAVSTNDKGKLFDVTTAATNVTATLPAASSSGAAWYCWIRKADTGAGLVLTSPVTSPAATCLSQQDQCMMIMSDGSNYKVVARVMMSVDSSGNVTFTTAGNIILKPGGTTPLINLFGTGATKPALKLSGTTTLWRLGDDSDYCGIGVDDLTVYGRAANGTDIDLGSAMNGTVDVDWSLGNSFYGQLSNNTTFTFSNPRAGQTIFMLIQQAAAGSKTLTWPTTKWSGGSAPTMTATASRYDAYTVKYINGIYVASTVQNMS